MIELYYVFPLLLAVPCVMKRAALPLVLAARKFSKMSAAIRHPHLRG